LARSLLNWITSEAGSEWVTEVLVLVQERGGCGAETREGARQRNSTRTQVSEACIWQ